MQGRQIAALVKEFNLQVLGESWIILSLHWSPEGAAVAPTHFMEGAAVALRPITEQFSDVALHHPSFSLPPHTSTGRQEGSVGLDIQRSAI